MNNRAIFALMTTLAISQTANASDDGFYVGVRLGGESLNSKLEVGTVSVNGTGTTGAIYGGYLGYFFPMGDSISLGMEAEYAKHDAQIEYKSSSSTRTIEFNKEYGANLRLNVDAYENVTFFGLAGINKAKIEGKASSGGKGDDKVRGTALGLGFEFKNESPIRLRFEYRYTKYKDVDFDPDVDVESTPKSHALTIGLHYYF